LPKNHNNNASFLRYALPILCFTFFLIPVRVEAQDDERDPVVWNVSFEGNETYRSMVLREIIATDRPNPLQKLFRRHSDFVLSESDLRRDRIRIMRYYERRGFIDVDVDYEIIPRRRDWRKRVVFHIREGEPVRIRSTEIEIDAAPEIEQEIRDARDFIRAADRHQFQPDNRYQTLQRSDVEGLFIRTLENLGFAWPEVEIRSEIDTTAKRADVTIALKPNDKSFFSNITIEGELSVPERILLRETDIREGGLYSRNKMQEAQRQIFNHHLFRFATVTLPEQPRDSTLDVLIRVREHPKRSVTASIGFGREELLRGQLSWQHRNISGTGHRFGVSGRASFIEQRLSTDYLIPYVFNPRSSNVTSLFGVHKLEPAFELFQAGFNNSLIYQVRRRATATASYELSFNEELSRDPDVDLPDNVLNYNVSSLTFSGYYTQGITREPRGWTVQPFVEFSGTFGESTFTFQKVSVDLRRFTHLSGTTILAARVNTGKIFFDQDKTLPSNILFFTGGTNSVRGWSRQVSGSGTPNIPG